MPLHRHRPDPAETPGKILVADDESTIRRTITRILRSHGHEIVEATSGRHALEILETTTVDVVLSDIAMPVVDGVDLLRRVQVRWPDLPVVLMTASPSVATAVEAVKHGAFDYLTKPFELDRLTSSMLRAVQAHRDAIAKRRILESGVRKVAPRVGGRAEVGRLQPGDLLLDRYRILGTLGSGGMGTVYAAEREDLGRMPVAVKLLHPTLAVRDESLKRFRREAEIVASMQHPNIVHILDFVSDEITFLVMELLNGETLATAVALEPPFPAYRAAFVAGQVLSALEAAHERRIVHRDLKPENIFLTATASMSDLVKVLDFGIAKLADEPHDSRLTQTGSILGTPAYMAPEHARGEPPTAQGDLYAVGCILYEMLAKTPPFVASNYNALLFAILDKEPTPLSFYRPELSKELCAVVAKAMAKDPADRYASASAMIDALAPWQPALPAASERMRALRSTVQREAKALAPTVSEKPPKTKPPKKPE